MFERPNPFTLQKNMQEEVLQQPFQRERETDQERLEKENILKKNLPIVAFFTGTGQNFNNRSKGYVSPEAYGGSKWARVSEKNLGNEETEHLDDDSSFASVVNQLSEDQKDHVYGFDGCHVSGGGINAIGIELPAKYLFTQVREQVLSRVGQTRNFATDIVISAHSRGCMSVFEFIQMVNADGFLRDKVNITLDLRDPVPGNLNFGVTNSQLTSGKLKNLSNCICVKKVHVTVMEAGNGPFGYDPLIPLFHKDTVVKVTALPGNHATQEALHYQVMLDKKGHHYIAHPVIYQLGLYKTLQTQLENGVAIDYAASLKELIALHQETSRRVFDREVDPRVDENTCERTSAVQADLVDKAKQFEGDLKNWSDAEKRENYKRFLKEVQVALYDNLLLDYQNNPQLRMGKRDLQFNGGRYEPVMPVKEANCLNEHHALLKLELSKKDKNALLIEGFRPYLGYVGQRKDLKPKPQKAEGDVHVFTLSGTDKTLPSVFLVKTDVLNQWSFDNNNNIKSKMQREIDTRFSNKREKDAIYRQLIQYQIDHAYEIYNEAQMATAGSANMSAEDRLINGGVICASFMVQLKELIRSVYGEEMPTNIRHVYNECRSAETCKDQRDLSEIRRICHYFNDVAGTERGNKSFFALTDKQKVIRKDRKVQYETFAKQFEELTNKLRNSQQK